MYQTKRGKKIFVVTIIFEFCRTNKDIQREGEKETKKNKQIESKEKQGMGVREKKRKIMKKKNERDEEKKNVSDKKKMTGGKKSVSDETNNCRKKESVKMKFLFSPGHST